MKICYIAKNLTPGEKDKYGGHRRFANELMDGSQNSGNEVTVVEGINVNLQFLRKYFSIRSKIKKCDIIHAIDAWPCAVIGWLAGLGLGKKLVITAEGTGSAKPFHHPLKKFLLTRTFKSAAAITAISKFTASRIKELVPGINPIIINHGINLDKFQNFSHSEEVLKYKPFVLSVGDIRKRKGYHLTLRVFAEVSKTYPDLNYVIVGYQKKDTYGVEISNLITALNLDKKVFIFKDAPDDLLNSFYENSEIFMLLPVNIEDDFEGFGLVFLEAAAHSLPAITSANNGSEDAVRNNESGIVVKQNNVQEAVEAMKSILENPNLRQKLSASAKSFATDMDWKNIIPKYLKIYETLS